jgi:hypothetical protein
MRSQSGASSVAKKENRSTALVGLKENVRQVVDGLKRKFLDGLGQLFEIGANVKCGRHEFCPG